MWMKQMRDELESLKDQYPAAKLVELGRITGVVESELYEVAREGEKLEKQYRSE
ncbi:MAG: hypothetical protein ACKOB3_02985 [Holophagaceae bacterium]